MRCKLVGPPVSGCPCQFCRDMRPPPQPKKQRPIMVRQGQIVK